MKINKISMMKNQIKNNNSKFQIVLRNKLYLIKIFWMPQRPIKI